MQIKRKLRINCAVMALSLVALIATLAVTALRVNHALERKQIADELMSTQMERLALRTDFLRTGSERAREQAQAKNRQVGQLLKLANDVFVNSADRLVIAQLIDNQESIGTVFRTIVANRQSAAAKIKNPDAAAEIEDRLVNQLNMRVYESAILASRLETSGRAKLVSVLRTAGCAVAVIFLLASAVTLVNSVLMSRAIVNRIGKLRESARLFGEGDLNHRAGLQGDDEFAELSAAFDSMAARLNDSYRIIRNEVEERIRAEEELKLAATVYRDSSEAMTVTDEDNHIIAVNQAFSEITGYEPGEVIGRNPSLLQSGHHDSAFYKAMWEQIQATGRYRGEIWNRRKNGEFFAAQTTINAVPGEDGKPHRYVALLSDITERKKSDELIWTQANFDALTGLPNRRLFRDRLQYEIRNARRNNQPLALMFLDLDGFKYVNDTLGHDMGDLLLKEVSERLKRCVRETDTVGRLGGDEFTVILTELHDPSNIDRAARLILKTVSEPILLGKKTAHVSASIGITLFPDDAMDIEDLIRNADQAMYAAKDSGKNQYHYFTPEMQNAAMARMRLVNDMHDALDENQFEIVYQPIVDLSTGMILKAEALIRWNHPQRGIINPVDFISAAEETGVINAFGDWIFREAAKQVSHWREKYHPAFQISVNTSPVQFRSEGIDPSDWLRHLSNLGLSGQGIVVDITESLLLEDNPKVADQLLALHDMGIEIALDDFGSGYSALSNLKKYHIDYIKIDQAFVKSLFTGANDLALCEAIVALAHTLGIKVIAEGIETPAQHEMLANRNCDFAQGFLFSRPVAADQFEILLETAPFLSQDELNI